MLSWIGILKATQRRKRLHFSFNGVAVATKVSQNQKRDLSIFGVDICCQLALKSDIFAMVKKQRDWRMKSEKFD